MPTIRFRRGTSTNGAARVLGQGEPAYETDTNRVKVGDGTTATSSLPHLVDSSELSASIDATGTVLFSPKGVTGTAPRYLDLATDFFGGADRIWVAGQGATGSALTSAASAGATTLAVADGTGFPTGTWIVANPASASQQIVKVTAGGGSPGAATLTLSAALTAGIASGTTVLQLWQNTKHLTTNGGVAALAYWLARRSALSDAVSGNKVTILGNSWIADGGTKWGTEIAAAHPGVTTVNAGVIGDTSALMLTRFAADVPTDSDFVIINEPGVNDISFTTAYATLSTRLAALVDLIRGIGAVPIALGPPPMFDNPARSSRLAAIESDLVTPSGAQYPLVTGQTLESRLAQTIATDSWGMGPSVLENTSGISNTAVGPKAGQGVTTGTQNTAVGTSALQGGGTVSNNTAVGYQALAQAAAGGNTAVGSLALKSSTSGAANTAVGFNAMLLTTTGGNDTAVGNGALALNVGGNSNTAVGASALASSTSANNNTALGYNALNGATTGGNNTAIGFSAGVTSTPANATKTGIDNVFIGTSSGPSGATGAGRAADPSSSIGLGRSARTGGNYAIAIGTQVIAGFDGAIAIGTDNAGGVATPAAVNEFVLGTSNHVIKTPGRVDITASSTTQAGLRLAHGAAPTSPVNGDMWTTTAGLFVRINGATVGPLT